MPSQKLSKVYSKKLNSTLDYATEDYLINALKLLSAKSRLPIKPLLTILSSKKADTVSCSRDDTNYHFFARSHKDKISIIFKELGNETMEFEISLKQTQEILSI